MISSMHDSFQHLSSLNAYKIDDVIEQVSKERQQLLNFMSREEEQLNKHIKNNTKMRASGFVNRDHFVKVHNTFLVLQKLKQNGKKKIKLDNTKELYSQILKFNSPPKNNNLSGFNLTQ